MKKIVPLIFALLVSLFATAQNSSDAIIKLNTLKHDFGKLKQGVPATYAFIIKNISNKPVVVESSWSSRGCTIPEQIAAPIMPGDSAKLKVIYNAAALGSFVKDVYIKLGGVDQPKTVQIAGEVLTVEEYEKTKKKGGPR